MAVRISRRKLASYFADAIVSGVSAKKLAMKLAAYLVESRRTKELQLVVGDIEHQLGLNGIVLANVTSAHELGEQTKTAITNLIEKQTGTKNIQLSEFVDPSVIGGVKLEFSGLELDTTVSRKLAKLKTNYK